MARNGRTKHIYKGTFVCIQTLIVHFNIQKHEINNHAKFSKPDCETVNRVGVARIPARDRVICVNFSSIPKNIKSVYKRMSLYKCPLYDHSWSFFCHMCVYLSQNWGSDGHFEVLNRPYLWLVENLWCKTQIFPFLFFCDFVQKQIFASFLFFTFFCFLS